MSKSKTRADDVVLLLLGESLDLDKHLNLSYSRPPTNKQVLLCVLANKTHLYNNRVKIEHHAKEEVLKKLEEHAAKSNLPLKSKCGLHSQINVLLKSYDKERAV